MARTLGGVASLALDIPSEYISRHYSAILPFAYKGISLSVIEVALVFDFKMWIPR